MLSRQRIRGLAVAPFSRRSDELAVYEPDGLEASDPDLFLAGRGGFWYRVDGSATR